MPNFKVKSLTIVKLFSEALTIWPVYAYTLAVQNTVIKLMMLILYFEDNTSMSCEDIHAKMFPYFDHYSVEF